MTGRTRKRPTDTGACIPNLAPFLMLLVVGGCVDIRVPDPQVRYIAFGDSTTAGPSSRDYPDLLRELLGEQPQTFANEGHGGETTQEGTARLRTLLADDIFPSAEVLLYWEAGNDISGFIKEHDPFLLSSPDDTDYPFAEELDRQLSETQGHIDSAIAAAQDAGLEAYVATYFFLREDFQTCDALPLNLILPSQAQRANAYLVRLNERIRSAAAQGGATLVDIAAADNVIRADRDNYHNCNHLSEQGNAIVAELFFDAITPTTD